MVKNIFITLAVILAVVGTVSGQTTIEAGFDLLTTKPFQTYIDLNDLLPICPNATNPVRVPLQGVPVITFPPAPGADLLNTDTIIERTDDGIFNGDQTLIQIEMVELQLRSIEPIQIDCGIEGIELWDLDIRLDTTLPEVGQMTVCDIATIV
ncbi:MAG: hypothetical protein ACYTA5_01370 [Planctomycetota bacterium]